MERPREGTLAGLTRAAYLVGLAAAGPTLWHLATHSRPRDLGLFAIGGLALVWLVTLASLLRAIVSFRRRGNASGPQGSVWLAASILIALSSLLPSSVGASVRATPPGVTAPQHEAPSAASAPKYRLAPAEEFRLVGLPLALVAKRRRDDLSRRREEPSEDEVDEFLDLQHRAEPELLDRLVDLIGDRRRGLIEVGPDLEVEESGVGGPVVVVPVRPRGSALLVAFARPGESLDLGPGVGQPGDLVESTAVVVGARGTCRFARDEHQALRALALRTTFDDVVVYLGPASDLEPEVAGRVVTVDMASPAHDVNSPEPSRLTAPMTTTVHPAPIVTLPAPRPDGPRVLLLRADPTVDGLAVDFDPNLRRRCVEMAAYLALHRGEPVTGDRLRTRVLGGHRDASPRTLANVATSLRRSLGEDGDGPRLEPVSSSGLYRTHGLDSDVEEFHRLVASARSPEAVGVADLLERALRLVTGEPMGSVLRGYDWFLAEGHQSRLLRDGEFAALRLCDEALSTGDYDRAFWAIERGRALDPYNETLDGRLVRIPRLRQFGGDRAG